MREADYQIAQGIADKALVIFVKKAQLKDSNSDTQMILSALSGIVTFKTAVEKKAKYNIVEDIMASNIDRDMEKALIIKKTSLS